MIVSPWLDTNIHTDVESATYLERLALKWVQRYISSFGGDPNQVTMYVDNAMILTHDLRMLSFRFPAGDIAQALLL